MTTQHSDELSHLSHRDRIHVATTVLAQPLAPEAALPPRMSAAQIAADVANRVPDERVYALAERMDCSTMAAREQLEAEAYAEITGTQIDYAADWREVQS